MSYPRETCAACGREISVRGGRFSDHGDPRYGTGSLCEGSYSEPGRVRTEFMLRGGRAAEISTDDLASHLLRELDDREFIDDLDSADTAIRELVRRAKK